MEVLTIRKSERECNSMSAKSNTFYQHLSRGFIILLLASAACLTSCGDNKEELVIPADILSKEKMVKVMVDIYLIDAATDRQNFEKVIMPPDPRVTYRKYLKKDDSTYEEFEKSYDFYIEHPKELSEIYTEVINELSRIQAEHSKKGK
jgi:hypothetical protein